MNGVLKCCFESKIPVEIIYVDLKGKVSQREIMIQDIKKDSIKALCLLRNQKWTFKVDNILAASMIKSKKSRLA